MSCAEIKLKEMCIFLNSFEIFGTSGLANSISMDEGKLRAVEE